MRKYEGRGNTKLFGKILLRVFYAAVGFLYGYVMCFPTALMAAFMTDSGGSEPSRKAAMSLLCSLYAYPIGGIIAAMTGYWIFIFLGFIVQLFTVFVVIRVIMS